MVNRYQSLEKWYHFTCAKLKYVNCTVWPIHQVGVSENLTKMLNMYGCTINEAPAPVCRLNYIINEEPTPATHHKKKQPKNERKTERRRRNGKKSKMAKKKQKNDEAIQ